MNGSALPCKARCSAAIGYFLTAMTGAFQSSLFQSGGQHFPKCDSRTFDHHLLTRYCINLPKRIVLPNLVCGGDFRSPAGQRKRLSFTDTQICDEPCNDTQGITDMKKGESGRKLRKGTQKHVNEFVANLPPKH